MFAELGRSLVQTRPLCGGLDQHRPRGLTCPGFGQMWPDFGPKRSDPNSAQNPSEVARGSATVGPALSIGPPSINLGRLRPTHEPDFDHAWAGSTNLALQLVLLAPWSAEPGASRKRKQRAQRSASLIAVAMHCIAAHEERWRIQHQEAMGRICLGWGDPRRRFATGRSAQRMTHLESALATSRAPLHTPAPRQRSSAWAWSAQCCHLRRALPLASSVSLLPPGASLVPERTGIVGVRGFCQSTFPREPQHT